MYFYDQITLHHLSEKENGLILTFFYHILSTPCDSAVIKGTLGGFRSFLVVFLPVRESNQGCWDRNPALYHMATLDKVTNKGVNFLHLMFWVILT